MTPRNFQRHFFNVITKKQSFNKVIQTHIHKLYRSSFWVKRETSICTLCCKLVVISKCLSYYILKLWLISITLFHDTIINFVDLCPRQTVVALLLQSWELWRNITLYSLIISFLHVKSKDLAGDKGQFHREGWM